MNKIGRWHKLKKVLPYPGKQVLLDIGENRFVAGRLEHVDYENGWKIGFTDDGEDINYMPGSDVKRWAYIKLE